jgi:predicted phosphodiesterase
MRFAVLADVHANLEALQTVLRDVDLKGIRNLLFLGDAVGYGPSPNECVEVLMERCKILLAGNHDWGVLGRTDVTYFNESARTAIEWTKEVLTKKNFKELQSWPIQEKMEKEDMLLVHSTPREPKEWHYLLTLWDAEINFNYFNNKYCFLGHSHFPLIIERLPSGELITYKDEAAKGLTERYIVNVGSVGQPRDGDPRASYAIVDDEKMEIVRVPYDIEAVQDKMRKAGLPSLLIGRLSVGK